jgi:4-hydroxy-4-methyl-2-oxoglutarate aldolase
MPDRHENAAAPDPRAEFLDLGAATVGESGGLPMRARVKAVWRGARLAAPAFPVRCTPGDNLAIHVAVASAPPGSALAVDVGDEDEFGYWGEVLTTAAQSRGVAGLVIDGGVRDTSALEAHGFPVFSTTVALRGASKNRPGVLGAPVEVGGVSVAAGDWLVGDADGVAVVRAAEIEDVLRAGRARVEKEEKIFGSLRQGQTTLELLVLDPSPVQGP